MNTRAILKEALKGCDRAEVAHFLGMSLGTLNNQVAGELPYFPKGRTQNILDRVYNLVDITHETTGTNVVLEKFAEEFGFILIANPAIRTDATPAVSKIAQILKEFSHVIDEIAAANLDGDIGPREAEGIRAKWEILKRCLEEFVLACETGRYRKGRE